MAAFRAVAKDGVLAHIKCAYRLLVTRMPAIGVVLRAKGRAQIDDKIDAQKTPHSQPSAHANQNERKQNTHIVWKGALPQWNV